MVSIHEHLSAFSSFFYTIQSASIKPVPFFIIIPIIILIGTATFFGCKKVNKKETRVSDNVLSRENMKVIETYRSKYQKFPGPSNEEILNVAKILVSSNLTTEKVEQLLGKPSDIIEEKSNDNKQVSLIVWGYNIGDNKGMDILFDPNGNLISVRGLGVDFMELKKPSNK